MIFKEYYKLQGDHFDIAERFHEVRESAVKKCLDYAESVGGKILRSNRDGSIRSILFDLTDPPAGWRKIIRHDGMIECTPHMGRKAGKKARHELDALPRVLEHKHILKEIAPDVFATNQFDGNRIYFPNMQRIPLPTVSYYVTVPRKTDDGLGIPPEWTEVRKSAYVRALEAHNDQVKRNREAEATP